MHSRLAAVMTLLLGCTSVGSATAPCHRYEAQRAALLTFVSTHRQVLIDIFKPCNGRGNPFHFIFDASQRKKALPETYQCYDAAQAALERAFVATFARPAKGEISLEIVHEGWVYANIELDSDGTVKNYGGEPSYGGSREVSDPHRQRGAGEGPIFKCGDVHVQIGGVGACLAVPFLDSAGKRLGEVHLVTVERW